MQIAMYGWLNVTIMSKKWHMRTIRLFPYNKLTARHKEIKRLYMHIYIWTVNEPRRIFSIRNL